MTAKYYSNKRTFLRQTVFIQLCKCDIYGRVFSRPCYSGTQDIKESNYSTRICKIYFKTY